DKDGRYEIHNVGAGHVAVSALHPDLALAPLHNLTVVDGGDYDVDLVLTLGDKLEGIVVDDSGKPVEGATVTARTLAQPRGLDLSMIAKFVRYEAETDAQGKFTLRGLITDRFFLEAEKTGFLNGKRVWRRGRDKEPVRLELSRGLFLAGRVVDQKGDPVTRFRIKAVPARRNELRVGPRWGRPQRNPNPYTDRSPWQRRGSFEIQDPNGEFRVGPLKAGKLQLSADAKGFVPSKRQTIELEDKNEVEPLVVELTKGVILRGRVLAGGAPVGDAQVTWRRHRERRRGFLPFKINVQPEDFDFMAMDSTLGTRSVITDANGAFELTGVSAGKVQLAARQPDYAKSESATLDIAVGEERSDIVLELRKGGAIEGSVTGLTGQPVKTAVIVALSIQAGVMKSSNTDAAGHYRISGLASGSYIVFKTKLDAALESLFADVLGNVRMKSTTVRDGRTSRVDIKDRTAGGVDVFGRVMSGNKPLPRAIVTLLGQDRSGPFGIGLRTATANDKGEYLLASVFPGKYMCQITRHTNARPEVASQSLVVPRGQMRIRADLHFPSCEIAGVVVDATGKPLKGVRVRAVGERRDRPGGLLGLIGDGGASRVRTDDAGQFRVRRLAPGSWTLHAAPRGAQRDHYGAGETSAIRVDTGGTINGVRIVLPLAAVLEGTVRDGNGAPIAGVAVRAFKDGERPSGKVADASMRSAEGFGDLRRALRHVTRSDSSGKWKLRGLLPGSWTVAAEKDGMFASGERRVRVGLGNNVPVDLQMKRGGRVYVRALGVDGKTLAGGTVRVLDSKGQQVGRAKSLFSLMASLFRSRNKDNKSQWMDMGTLPPDTYTLEVTQKLADGKKQVRTTKRTLREGEEARWVVKVEELVQR
ncbi:MAG: carboxypeptidase-like regulatory domain-containing protein, partial [Planctomycetota bacterium]|nr:carboxypeptidase-like regulatory domain-containing protein [Planctomycetota bacterium]